MRNKIIETAQKELGYKEVGDNKTKYGDWYGMNGEWCAMFISWLANQVGILNNLIPKQSYVPTMVTWFKNKQQFKARGLYPQIGDIIFFDYNGNGTSDHVGIVEKCENGIITTIEGNKSKMVKRCTYNVNNSGIYGFGIVAYPEEKQEENLTKEYTHKQFVGDVQKAIGAKVDFIAGTETLSKTVTVSATKNRTHAVIRPIQKYLYALGYTEIGKDDCVAGPKFDKVVKRFQKDNGCIVDGEITARNKTWKKLLKLA